jgi:EF-P beta-lysylation protein EpmB
MITETTGHCQSPHNSALPWQEELRHIITDPAELWQLLELPLDLLPAAHKAAKLFQLKAPRPLVGRMRKGDLQDPLLRQVLPLIDETESSIDLSTDPYFEAQANPHPGLLHKYKHRVLLIATGTCAINCRYCFRRHFPYNDNNPGRLGWQSSLDYIAADSTIHEVILSGGDPLIASDNLIAWFIEQLSAIPHVQIVRFHTRLPIVIPQRVTPELLRILTSTRLTPVMIMHANHAQEIDAEVEQALLQIKAAGITLLNQSVLLRGVNDQAEALIALSYRLFNSGVLPYYLHQCDPVKGTAHFVLSDQEALQLHQQMQHHLPGYLVPRLVRERPGSLSKEWMI